MKTFESLTYLGQVRRLRKLAQAALDDYGLAGARLTFIARSENTTFRVDTPDPPKAADDAYVAGRYVLRVHRPAYQTLESLTSEMQWLAALRSEAGLAVPKPVPTVTGEWLAEVAVPGMPGLWTCSLLRWVKGRKPWKNISLRHFRALGRVTAQLHQHAAHWKPPTGFTRRCWNWEGLFGEDAGFNLPASAVWELLPEPYCAPFETVAAQTRQLMDDWGEGLEAFGLLHADLSIGEEENVLLHGGEARPIDFDDCGYGYWVYDFATSLAHWQETGSWHKIRGALLDGYAEMRPLPKEQLAHLDLFMAARHVSEVLWAVDLAQSTPDFREQLGEWLEWAAKHVRLYLDSC
ncbi:MAG: phosphotransferase [Chloroflexota bacterium]|nr:phosphotransferase [Chloroflexota bacterium]